MNKKLILIICLFLACIFVSSFEKVLAFPASSSEIYAGIDVSEWQGNIDFTEVKNSGIDIVYIKSSEGTRYIDPYFRTNYNSAKENGLNIGFYHFMTATTENEAIAEARFFASVVNGLDADCRLAMDFEIFDGLDVREINDISLAFLTEVKRLTEKEVVVYDQGLDSTGQPSGVGRMFKNELIDLKKANKKKFDFQSAFDKICSNLSNSYLGINGY